MKKAPRQYTIRNVPEQVDAVLRQRAREMKKSFNQVVLDALVQATGAAPPARDLDDIVGTMSIEEASRLDEEVRHQRQIDPNLWQ